jgi:hypothetical protein
MSTTKRHHFIPVFFLKQFTNDDGFFYIYDVKKGIFKNRGKRFAPSTHFYEHFGNTVSMGNADSEFVEAGYSDHDSKVSPIISKVVQNENWTLTPDEWTMLQYFVNIMHWRIPVNINKVKSYISSASSLQAFRMKLMNSSTNKRVGPYEEMNLLDKMKSEPDFYKYVKLLLPAITYPDLFNKPVQDSATIQHFPFAIPKLISDNPIIYRTGQESLHTDEFVFPLSPTHLLLRHKAPKIRVWSWVKLLSDMLMLVQASEYVAVTDKSYPVTLLEQYNKNFSSIERLRNELFKGIIPQET